MNFRQLREHQNGSDRRLSGTGESAPYNGTTRLNREKKYILIVGGIAAGIALLLVPFASVLPDGLETVLSRGGAAERDVLFRALMPGYGIPHIPMPHFAAGITGAGVCFLVVSGAMWIVQKLKLRSRR